MVITSLIALLALCTGAASSLITTHHTFTLHEEDLPMPITPLVSVPAPAPATVPSTPPATTTPPYPGAKSGMQMGWRPEEVRTFEEKTGITLDLVGQHIHWGNERDFPSYLGKTVAGAGKTLVVFWNPMDYTKPIDQQQTYSYAEILSGTWDSYFTSFARQASEYSGPVILIPLEEPNGDWDAWGGSLPGNSPAQYIAAYRHIHEFFTAAPNVSFGWAVNFESVPNTPENQLEKYYPGDAYVDYVGVDGFNFGDPWMTFEEIFADPFKRLATYNKPIYIFSIASAEGEEKAQWIRDFLASPLLRQYSVVGWLWFNEDKEKDWRLWSSPAALEAFKEAYAPAR